MTDERVLCFVCFCVFFSACYYFDQFFRNRSKGYANVSDSDDSETEEIDPDKLPALEVLPGEHKLQYNYCLWYHKGSMTKFKSPNVSLFGPILLQSIIYRTEFHCRTTANLYIALVVVHP